MSYMKKRKIKLIKINKQTKSLIVDRLLGNIPTCFGKPNWNTDHPVPAERGCEECVYLKKCMNRIYFKPQPTNYD